MVLGKYDLVLGMTLGMFHAILGLIHASTIICDHSVVTMRGEDDCAHHVDHVGSREKVDMATMVAKSIAAVHEIDGPDRPVALVHNDLNANNIFMGPKNVPLLNDFNIAVLMMKDRHTNASCSFPGHFPNEQVSLYVEFESCKSAF